MEAPIQVSSENFRRINHSVVEDVKKQAEGLNFP